MISKQPGGPPGCAPRWSHKPHPPALLYFPLLRGGFFLSSAWFVGESAPTAIPSCLAEREVFAYIQIN